VAGHDHLTSPNLGGLDKFASEPRKVDKPWGYELIWAVTDSYAGKILFVKAGESLSLQFHNVKDEAWYILEGRAKLELSAPGERMLNNEVIGPGAAFHFPPRSWRRRRHSSTTSSGSRTATDAPASSFCRRFGFSD
jgi:mannose-6-phosphate isomerase-like protein (cupin superfamily)